MPAAVPRDSAPPLEEDEDELESEGAPLELDEPPPGRLPLGYSSRPSSASIRVEVSNE